LDEFRQPGVVFEIEKSPSNQRDGVGITERVGNEGAVSANDVRISNEHGVCAYVSWTACVVEYTMI